MRPAAGAWEKDYADKLETRGLVRGKAAPTVFWNPVDGTIAFVHGDDFVFLGEDEKLKEARRAMEEWYQIKVKAVLGPEAGDDKEAVVLGRVVRWTADGVEYEADPRVAKRVIEAVGLKQDSKGFDCMVQKHEEEMEEDLDVGQAKEFRSVAALVNYLAVDRPDLQYAVGLLCRKMAKPTGASLRALKRVARYLVRYPRVGWRFRDIDNLGGIKVFSDSDWAGELGDRKSTSGGVITMGGAAVKTWSRRQATIALSSGEAEYCAVVKATAEALGIQALAQDLG